MRAYKLGAFVVEVEICHEPNGQFFPRGGCCTHAPSRNTREIIDDDLSSTNMSGERTRSTLQTLAIPNGVGHLSSGQNNYAI
jgi:hypothetical protein